MMKKVLLTAVIASLGYSAVAQCTPDPSYDPQSESGAGISDLECAVVNQAYTGNSTIVIPSTVEYSGFTVSVCKVKVNSLSGMPASVDPIEPTVSIFYNGTTYGLGQEIILSPSVDRGCVTFNGTFTQTFDDTIYVTGTASISTNNCANILTTIPFSALHNPGLPVSFHVKNTQSECDATMGIEETISNNSFDVAQNYPNPFSGESQVAINLPASGKYTFRVMNLVGKTVKEATMSGNSGMNYINVSSADYAAGVYMYSVSFGGKTVTKRMIIK